MGRVASCKGAHEEVSRLCYGSGASWLSVAGLGFQPFSFYGCKEEQNLTNLRD